MPTQKKFYGHRLDSPLMLGTALYPSPAILAEAFTRSQASVATLSLRRENSTSGTGEDFYNLIRSLGVQLLPNTAGCYSVKEAVTTAHMARELFGTNWIKLEVIGQSDRLHPDLFALVEAAKILCDDGFAVFPYCTEDLSIAERLCAVGCQVLMPWAAPIGSGLGLCNRQGLRALRAEFAEIPLVVDAGLGRPSHAAAAMELGYDAVLLNSAVTRAGDPARMAEAFAQAVHAGQQAAAADPMEPRDLAQPSTPVLGKAFLS